VIRIATATLALSVLATAQAKVYGPDEAQPRMATTKLVLDESQGYKMLAAACIQYGSPEWKPEYDGMADKAKGKSLRLGKDFWTTMNTTATLTVGGTRVPAGNYYLGLHCDDKGSFHLAVIDAKTANTNGWTPWMANEWKPDYTCALTHSKGKETVKHLSITLQGEDASQLNLKLAWGGHELTAPVQMSTGTTAEKAKDAAGTAIDKAKTEAVDTKKLPEPVKK
jgi:hypothetical protein